MTELVECFECLHGVHHRRPRFVGLNMMQASVTGLCPAALILKVLGTKPGAAFGQAAAAHP